MVFCASGTQIPSVCSVPVLKNHPFRRISFPLIVKIRLMIRRGVFFLLVCLCLAHPAAAQESQDKDLQQRRALAEKMLAINPVRDQVRMAIDQYIDLRMKFEPVEDQDAFRAALMAVLNYQTLEQISLDTYVQTFTTAELAAMVEYYSKPEAISARKKWPQFDGVVSPQIIKMLDQALIKARTQAQ